jgi:fatty-acyl-CoA synthase
LELLGEVEMDWVKRWAVQTPDAIAFQDAESKKNYTYAALYAITVQLAAHLNSEFSIGMGDRVSVLANNEMEYVPLFFAIQRLGAILVPLNTRLTPIELARPLSDATAKLIVVQSQFKQTLQDALFEDKPTVWMFDGEKSLTAFVQSAEMCRAVSEAKFAGNPSSACMILYTSGTTGNPKGVVLTNAMLYWNSIDTGLRLNLVQNDVFVSFLPFFHTGGWHVLLTPFVHRGAKTILLKKFSPDQVLQAFEKFGATIIFGVPTTMEMMSRAANFETVDLSSARYAIVGGETLRTELIHTWLEKGIPIRQGYGLTEFGPSAFSLHESDSLRKAGSIGTPNPHVEAKVLSETGLEVKTDEIGELVLRGPACMNGYWQNELATGEILRNGWLYTGDLVRIDDEGYFFICGRKKEMIKSGGENIDPNEVENVLAIHPAICEVVVIGIPDEKWGEVGKAFVSLHPGASVSAEELINHCSGKLAKFKIPKKIEFKNDLPKSPSGKIIRHSLS